MLQFTFKNLLLKRVYARLSKSYKISIIKCLENTTIGIDI